MAVIDISMDMPKYCWSTNDERFLYCERYETCKYRDIHTFDYVPDTCPLKELIIDDMPSIEAIPQADYENRLKADMVAMLTEIQLDIQEVNTAPQFLTDDNVKDFRECIDTIIQQKINALSGNEDDN